jgi:hypothetical protein
VAFIGFVAIQMFPALYGRTNAKHNTDRVLSVAPRQYISPLIKIQGYPNGGFGLFVEVVPVLELGTPSPELIAGAG